MRNKTGKPFALKELDEEGHWNIYFDPSPKLDGYFYYECLRGPIDVTNAELIVGLLLEQNENKIAVIPVECYACGYNFYTPSNPEDMDETLNYDCDLCGSSN